MRRGLFGRSAGAVLALALVLVACAPPPVVPPEQVDELWEQRLDALGAVQDWSMSGRVAVQVEEEGWNATVHWRQQPDAYDIRLLAPIGGGALRLRGDPSGVVLRTSDGEVYTAASPEALVRERTGLALPVSGLRHWVLGRPDPLSASAQSLDAVGRLVRLRQHGWDILYQGYRDVGEWELPSRMVLYDGRFEVRLAIDRWEML
jgi:outer membrane lipoprotein LolB